MISSGRPSGRRRTPSLPLLESDLLEELDGRLAVIARPAVAIRLAEERALRQHGVVRLDREAEIEHLVHERAVDAQGKRSPEAHVAQKLPPHRIFGVEVREKREVRTLARPPEERAVAVLFFALLEKRVLLKCVARLQVGFPGAGLRRNELGVGHGEHEAVDIGELLAALVHPMEVRIAHGDEAVGGRARGIHPRLQRRQIRVVRFVRLSARLCTADQRRFAVPSASALRTFSEYFLWSAFK